MTEAPCCTIPCDNPAIWEVTTGQYPDDNTLSCSEHLAESLAPLHGRPDPGEYVVRPFDNEGFIQPKRQRRKVDPLPPQKENVHDEGR